MRNAINSHKRAAKKRYFQELLSDKNNSRSTWTAINQLTNKTSNPKHQVTNNISAEQLNDHFSTIAEKIVTSNPKSNSLDKLQEFCLSKNIQSKFDIPLMTVTEVYNALKYLKQSGTRDLDGLDTKILRLAAPLITNTLTCLQSLHNEKYFSHCFQNGQSYSPVQIWRQRKPIKLQTNLYCISPIQTT